MSSLLGACAGAVFETWRPAATPEMGKLAESSTATPPAQPSMCRPAADLNNLGAPQDTWIRLEGSIVFDPKTLPHPEAVAGYIGDDVFAYLRTVSVRQLEGPIGLEDIRQDLNERAVTWSGGKVRAFVIRTLVVQ